MAANKLSNNDKLNLVKDYQTGIYNYVTLGKKYTISATQVGKYINRLHLPKNKLPRKRMYTLDESFFEKINTEEKSYFLGWLYSDGYNYEQRGKITINLQEEDVEILHKLNLLISSNRPLLFISKLKNNCKNQYRLRIDSKKISKDLVNLGCFQSKSLTLKFPSENQVPSDLLQHFIRGYFDGDGSFYKYTRNDKYTEYGVSIVSSTSFCILLQDWLKTNLNIIFGLEACKNPKTSVLKLGNRKQIFEFLDWLYQKNNICLRRKYVKYCIEKNLFENSSKKWLRKTPKRHLKMKE